MNPLARDFLKDPEFAAYVSQKQAIDHVFYDTKTVAAAGLGAAGGASPATQLWFDGLTASNVVLTNILGKNQMEQDEVAAIIGISVTPLAVHAVFSGAAAANVNGAQIAQDVDQILKRSVLTMRFGTNSYGSWPTQSLGGDGGLSGLEGGMASTSATAGIAVRSSPNNGSGVVGSYWKWFHPVLWYGKSQLSIELAGNTGAISADLPVRIGIHCSPFWRNVRPESPLRLRA